jgi:hypothetical protein
VRFRKKVPFQLTPMGMVSSFLRDRSMVVEVNGVESASRSLSSGVPQGCIPSSLFFSMFINDLCSCIRFSKFHFYADDLQIYLSGDKKDLDEMTSALNEDLTAISQWSAENGLLLNPPKVAGDIDFEFCFGHGSAYFVVIDGRICFDCQVTKECSRVYTTLHRLRFLKLSKALFRALFLPYFFCCDVVFSHLSSVGSRRLQVAFFIVMNTYLYAGTNSF